MYVCIYLAHELRIYSGESQRAVDHRTTLPLLPAVLTSSPDASPDDLLDDDDDGMCVCVFVYRCMCVYTCSRRWTGKRGHDFSFTILSSTFFQKTSLSD